MEQTSVDLMKILDEHHRRMGRAKEQIRLLEIKIEETRNRRPTVMHEAEMQTMRGVCAMYNEYINKKMAEAADLTVKIEEVQRREMQQLEERMLQETRSFRRAATDEGRAARRTGGP
ncbi:hypothetical protein CAPTEDRAFT_197528 [Capitella teleta]|uniref:Uncharacterized protein n=1 Tax=Capitella teleta TaxID=283909 RepID=R7UXS6_CAPTE|nr:hypothetical protein CAPTEDRAFT_197528 [Capitella teleta]|eukprot:ELU08211.1 hypothetical protein CAPTEDRAFT_197528 [Capitella teleta]